MAADRTLVVERHEGHYSGGRDVISKAEKQKCVGMMEEMSQAELENTGQAVFWRPLTAKVGTLHFILLAGRSH